VLEITDVKLELPGNSKILVPSDGHTTPSYNFFMICHREYVAILSIRYQNYNYRNSITDVIGRIYNRFHYNFYLIMMSV